MRGSPRKLSCREVSVSKSSKLDSEIHTRIPMFPGADSTKLSLWASGGFAGKEFVKGVVEETKGLWVGGRTAVGVGEGEGSVMVIPTLSMVPFSGFVKRGSNSEMSCSHAAGGRGAGGQGGCIKTNRDSLTGYICASIRVGSNDVTPRPLLREGSTQGVRLLLP